MLQKSILVSIFENAVVPVNQCDISSNVGALWCSVIIALFKSWGLRHILSEPSGFVGYVMDETHSASLVTGAVICSCSISLSFFSVSSL